MHPRCKRGRVCGGKSWGTLNGIVKKNLLIVFVNIILTGASFAQGISNRWVLGYQSLPYGKTVFIFDNDSLRIDSIACKMNFFETNANISSNKDSFLFSTNGIWILNSANDTMQNGSGLAPSLFTSIWHSYGSTISQAALIIPFPEDTNKYYLFHETGYFDTAFNFFPPHQLLLTTIDMSLDGGKGAVTQKNIPIYYDSLLFGKLTACKHANGRDWWVIAHRKHSDLFNKFLVTPQGVLGPYSQNIGNVIFEGAIGQAVFSPDGKHYAYYSMDDGIEIFDFDRCSGDFYHHTHISNLDSVGFAAGVAFSPNSEYLYVSSYQNVYQYNVLDPNIASTIDTVAVYDGFISTTYTEFYLAQLAPDGKIYICTPRGTERFHVINYPDSDGASCGFVQHGILLHEYNSGSIPNHPNYFLGADSGSVCDTLMLGTSNLLSEKRKLTINLYPNPSKDKLIVSYQPFDKPQTLEVVDISGKTILKSNVPQWSQYQSLDISKLFEGIYLCRLVCRDKMVSGKFVISR